MKQKLLLLSLFLFGVLVGLLFATSNTYIYNNTEVRNVQEGDYVDGLGTLRPNGCFDLKL